jgi:hypothetical protein
MLTRQQAQLALTHVLEMLFQFTNTDHLPLALTRVGYTDIHQLIMMTQDKIDALLFSVEKLELSHTRNSEIPERYIFTDSLCTYTCT